MRSTDDVEDGVVIGLLNAEVGETGDLAEFGEHLVRDLAVVCDLGAFDLDVDGRGQAEVEDLRDDVRGKEIEGGAGKLAREVGAKGTHEVGGGSVFFLEGDEDVGITGTNKAGGGVLGVERAVGQADVVEDIVDLIGRDLFAEVLLDEVAETRGFFDAGTAARAEMEDEGAVVGAGEEVLPEEGNEQEDAADRVEGRWGRRDARRSMSRPRSRFIAAADALERALKGPLKAGKDIAGARGHGGRAP